MSDIQKEEKALCGGCQQNGFPPTLVDGVCSVCDRTVEQIIAAHGRLEP